VACQWHTTAGGAQGAGALGGREGRGGVPGGEGEGGVGARQWPARGGEGEREASSGNGRAWGPAEGGVGSGRGGRAGEKRGKGMGAGAPLRGRLKAAGPTGSQKKIEVSVEENNKIESGLKTQSEIATEKAEKLMEKRKGSKKR